MHFKATHMFDKSSKLGQVLQSMSVNWRVDQDIFIDF